MPRKLVLALLWVTGAGLALAWYLRGCSLMWDTNKHWEDNGAENRTYDQKFYVDRAEEMVTGHNADSVARSRMPGYPWMLHFFYSADKSASEQFEVYKKFNITLSCLALAGICLLGSRLFGPALAIPITLITAGTFFVFKAILVQPEITFFFCYLCVFLLMLRCLQRPHWGWGLALGVLTGLSHLLKGSALPTIMLFLALAAVRGALDWWRNRRAPERRKFGGLGVFATPACFVAGFLAVTGYYLSNSYRHYGSPFYDPNSKHYFWADEPDEMAALQGVNLAYQKPSINRWNYQNPVVLSFLEKWEPDAVRREQLLKTAAAGGETVLEGEWDILPSFKNWKKHHTLRDALDRIWDGLADSRNGIFPRNAAHRNGYFYYTQYFCAAMVFLCLIMAIYRRRELWAGMRGNILPILFAVGSIAGNFLLYAWWAQISSRNRFFLTQFLPILFSTALVIRWAAGHLSWEAIKVKVPQLRLPGWLGGALIRGPFVIIVVVFLWRYLWIDLRDVRRLDSPKEALRNLRQ